MPNTKSIDGYTLTVWAVLILSLCFFGVFRKESDAELSAHRYCRMVNSGQMVDGKLVKWPDYQKNYDKFCIGDRWNGK